MEYGQLDKAVRARLRTLSKANAEDVGRHLIMVGLLLDSDPELAYRHAQVAASRGGRVDVVREAAGMAAYASGRYAEALRELRTVRRLNGSDDHLPIMADCERGLGRPERAIALAQSPEVTALDAHGRAEMQIVLAGARRDLGDTAAAIATLTSIVAPSIEVDDRRRAALADALRGAGREDEAARVEPAAAADDAEDEEWETVVYDTQTEPDPDLPADAADAAEPTDHQETDR